jgi:hypothetical protein
MKIVYIAHPINGNIQKNLADIRRIVRHINLTMPDIVPFVPYYADIVSMDDNNIEERERGIKNDTELMHRNFIDEVWLTGSKLSKGMKSEQEIANILSIPVINMINKI